MERVRARHDKTRQKRTLTGSQEAALGALLGGSTVTEAAEAAGVSRQTASGWLNQDPDFAAELGNRRQELWRAVGSRLEAHALKAVDRLVALLDEPDHRIQIRAATELLKRFDSLPVPGLMRGAQFDPHTVKTQWAREAERAEMHRLLEACL